MKNIRKDPFIYILTALGLFVVIVVGAYTRIKDAGLGCPDWPGCYGYVLPPEQAQVSPELFSLTGFDRQKAWIEMWHRYIAGFMGFVVISLAFVHLSARKNIGLSIALILCVFMQANLGRLTVTMKLQPLIVSLHLLGGLSLLFLTLILGYRSCFTLKSQKLEKTKSRSFAWKKWFILLMIFYAIQVVLGAWVSTNYAGLACQHFPGCHQDHFFPWQISERFFQLSSLYYSDQPLSFFSWSDKMSIHMIHRLNALLLGVSWLISLYFSWSDLSLRAKNSGITLGVLYFLQVFLALWLVKLRLPVYLATMHNALAALMGISLIDYYYHALKISNISQVDFASSSSLKSVKLSEC